MTDDKAKAEQTTNRKDDDTEFEVTVNLLITKKGGEKPQVTVRLPEPGTAV